MLLFCAAVSAGCNLLYALADSVEDTLRSWAGMPVDERHQGGILPDLALTLIVLRRAGHVGRGGWAGRQGGLA